MFSSTFLKLVLVFSVVSAFPSSSGNAKGSVLVQQSLNEFHRPGGVVPGDGCLCVPFYQCEDGYIITDGAGLLDPRSNRPGAILDQRCTQAGQLCCLLPGSPRVTTSAPTSTKKPYKHSCGQHHDSGLDSRILSTGRQSLANYGEWPWQVALLLQQDKKELFQGGAVLVDRDVVLTAAHKVQPYERTPHQVLVSLGAWNLSSNSEPRQTFQVSKIVVHPQYDADSLANDIAVLKLNGSVVYSETVDTICLPGFSEDHTGDKCTVLGWGKTDFDGPYSRVLKQVELPVIETDVCQDSLRQTRLGVFFNLDNSFICAGGTQGLDACVGDGGGPLACVRDDGSYALVGLVSWGINCGQPGIPGVYVDVKQYLTWIALAAR